MAKIIFISLFLSVFFSAVPLLAQGAELPSWRETLDEFRLESKLSEEDWTRQTQELQTANLQLARASQELASVKSERDALQASLTDFNTSLNATSEKLSFFEQKSLSLEAQAAQLKKSRRKWRAAALIEFAAIALIAAAKIKGTGILRNLLKFH